MHKTIDWQIRIFAILVMFSFLFPAIKIGGFGMKLDLIFLMPLLLSVLLVDTHVKSLDLFKNIFIIGFLLFANMLLADTFGLVNFSSQIGVYFPTEFIQIFSRIFVFYCFYYIGYEQLIKFISFKKYYNIIFLVALLFGFLQSLNIGIITTVSKYYALTDVQLKGFESIDQRGFGVAGNIITWGGISGFIFFYFYYLSDSLKYKLIGCSLAILNITLSVSRSAIISLIASFILINLLVAIVIKKNVIAFFKIIMVLLVSFSIVFFAFTNFFPDRYELIMRRFSYMNEALNESGRGAQREFFFKFMNVDYWNYFIGIGKPTIDRLGYMEMEPIFLIVAYGIVGFVLHYSLIYINVMEIFKSKSNNENEFGFIIGSTIFYLIFSIGFFFMRESYSGLLYWVLIGYVLGTVYKLKTNENYS